MVYEWEYRLFSESRNPVTRVTSEDGEGEDAASSSSSSHGSPPRWEEVDGRRVVVNWRPSMPIGYNPAAAEAYWNSVNR